MTRLLRLVMSLAMLLFGAFWLGTSAFATTSCTAGINPTGQSVYYCGVWLPSGGIPVYANTSTGSTVVDHIHTAGSGNWFYCQKDGGTASASGYTSSNWARTVGDDNGATGYVPAVYYSGTQNYWAGMAACSGGSSPGGTRCTSGSNLAGTTVWYCPVWLPSGGVPVYSSTTTGSTVVDHLHTGGDANWFYCQKDGGTASAGGYTSSNWAKTIGDDNGATGYVPAVYFTGSQNFWAGVPGCATPPPPPADSSCNAGYNGSGQSVYYCPVWLPSGGVPLYASTSTGSGVVDHLHTGGSANWFYCRVSGSTATVSGYSSSSWAKTIGDDNGKTGWVPAVYFDGTQDYWPNLPSCGSGTGNPPPPPPPSNGGGTTSGSACGLSFGGLTTLTFNLIKNMCLVTVPSDPIYAYSIYSWNGGHGATPGPTYGSCDAKNGAPNDCHVKGFDCSGLVRWAYWKTTGIDALDGYTWQQWTEALSLPHKAVINAGSVAGGAYRNVDNYLSQLKPGDVLFYGNNANKHVAVYVGNGKQMNAWGSTFHDSVTSVTTSDNFWGAVRLWG